MSDHNNDGIFHNPSASELSILQIPAEPKNYYMEFVVWPYMDLSAGTYDPSNDTLLGAFPGPLRILLGSNGEVYFTGDTMVPPASRPT